MTYKDPFIECMQEVDGLLVNALDKITVGHFEKTVKSGMSEVYRGPKMQVKEFIERNYDLFVDFCDMDVNDEVSESKRKEKATDKAEEVMIKIYGFYVVDDPIFISCKLC